MAYELTLHVGWEDRLLNSQRKKEARRKIKEIYKLIASGVKVNWIEKA